MCRHESESVVRMTSFWPEHLEECHYLVWGGESLVGRAGLEGDWNPVQFQIGEFEIPLTCPGRAVKLATACM